MNAAGDSCWMHHKLAIITHGNELYGAPTLSQHTLYLRHIYDYDPLTDNKQNRLH